MESQTATLNSPDTGEMTLGDALALPPVNPSDSGEMTLEQAMGQPAQIDTHLPIISPTSKSAFIANMSMKFLEAVPAYTANFYKTIGTLAQVTPIGYVLHNYSPEIEKKIEDFFITPNLKQIEGIEQNVEPKNFAEAETYKFMQMAGQLGYKLPLDAIMGSGIKDIVATVIPQSLATLNLLPNFAVGAIPSDLANGGLLKATENAATNTLYGHLAGGVKGFLSILALGPAQAFYTAAQERRLPTKEELASATIQNGLLGAAFWAVPALASASRIPLEKEALREYKTDIKTHIENGDTQQAQETVTKLLADERIRPEIRSAIGGMTGIKPEAPQPQGGTIAPAEGKVTVYYRTDVPIEQIKKEGIKSLENTNEIFVSNQKEGQAIGYGKNVIELKIDQKDLRLDDEFPNGEQHFAVSKDIADKALSSIGEGQQPPIEPPKTAVSGGPLPEPEGTPQPQPSQKQIAEKIVSSPSEQSIPQREQASQDAVQKIITALKEAKPIRGKQEALYTKERAARIAKATAMGEKIPGEKGFHAQLGSLKGEMPKVQYESLRGKLSQPDIDAIFDKVRVSHEIDIWDKISAQTGLAKIFGEMGGEVPTQGELKVLNKVFGSDFTKAVLEKRSLMQKVGDGAGQVLNIPRSIMASFDLSAPLRQGFFMIGRPKQFGPAFVDMFKYFASEKALQAAHSEIVSRPTYKLMKEGKLSLTDLDAGLNTREERFMSNWAEQIPLIGKGIRASGRAYTGFLNKLRADVFDDLVNKGTALGLKPEEFNTDLATFINSATGRGKLGPTIEKAAVALRGILFSPRLIASRINMLNPKFYVDLDPFVRKEALKSLVSSGSIALTTVTLAALAGATVEKDPRSADFGKIKLGNTRIDPWGGSQQYVKLAAQLISGQIVSSTTGTTMTLGEGYKPMTRFDIIQRFFESKENPVASFITGLLRGKDTIGKDFKPTKEIALRFVPMVIQDLYDLQQEKGWAGTPLIIPGVFGAGLQTYTRDAKETVSAYKSVEDHAKILRKQGDIQGAKDLLEKNQEIISEGKRLEAPQKIISSLKKKADDLKKNKTIPSEVKKVMIEEINKKVEARQKISEAKLKELKSKYKKTNE